MADFETESEVDEMLTAVNNAIRKILAGGQDVEISTSGGFRRRVSRADLKSLQEERKILWSQKRSFRPRKRFSHIQTQAF